MPGIVFATVLIRIIRAICDATTSVTPTVQSDLNSKQPVNQNAPPYEGRARRHAPQASRASQCATKIREEGRDQKEVS